MGDDMDEYLSFETPADAEACLAEITALMLAKYAAEGYAVDGAFITAKNAATGQDAPESKALYVWDEIQEMPDGFYILAPDKVHPGWESQVQTPYIRKAL